jgi:hypothetical protein
MTDAKGKVRLSARRSGGELEDSGREDADHRMPPFPVHLTAGCENLTPGRRSPETDTGL